jgi:2-polyprenyl-6-hydroxyphenyl methylase/3-demethylubiquinone-9 3-methyltransferase
MLIVGAEHILRWLPKGTHEWDKFIKPEELEMMLEKSNLINIDKKGFVFNPISWDWSISNSDLSVNYVVACKRKT